jgi:hypothetical protein
MSVFRNRRAPETTTLCLPLDLTQEPPDSRETRRGSI